MPTTVAQKKLAARPMRVKTRINLTNDEVKIVRHLLKTSTGSRAIAQLRKQFGDRYAQVAKEATVQNIATTRIFYSLVYPNRDRCTCGKRCRFINSVLGYRTFCGASCATKDPIRIKKFKKVFGKTIHKHPEELTKLKKLRINFKSKNGQVRLKQLRLANKPAHAYVLRTASRLGVSTSQVLYHMRHQLKEIPKCECNKHTRFKSFTGGYSKYCVACCGSSEEVKRKVKEIHNILYGGSPLQNKVVQAKIRETNQRRYGCDNPMQNKRVARKSFLNNSGSYGLKEVKIGKHVFHVAGYERFAVARLIKMGYIPDKIKTGENVKAFSYDGARTYYPDIQYGRKIFEIKSTYTAGSKSIDKWTNLVKKANAVIKAGYYYRLLILSGSGKILLTTRNPKQVPYKDIQKLKHVG